MRIKDEKLLDVFRGPGLCGWCGQWCLRREPHHCISRGAGGSDVEENILPLGIPWDCGCHAKFHNGKMTQRQMIDRVADRLGLNASIMLGWLWSVREADKDGPIPRRPWDAPRTSDRLIPIAGERADYHATAEIRARAGDDVPPGIDRCRPGGSAAADVETDEAVGGWRAF